MAQALPTMLCLLTLLQLSETSFGFIHSGLLQKSMFRPTNICMAMANSKKPGTFFNAVPDNEDDDKTKPVDVSNNTENSFEESLSELMKKRNVGPPPSTIGGVPTSKATGFAKNIPKSSSKSKKPPTKPFISVGPPTSTDSGVRYNNDINNPEYDDQGYVLHTNEQTGEKKRVFEALVSYPCDFKIKIIGANESTFVSEMVELVAESCEVQVDKIQYSERKKGKWISVTVNAPVKSAEMLYALYESIDRDPRVKYKF